jgi:hypothetical protein
MEVQDGFIVGIYNYCDRWCEACALTSRCRVFADAAEMEASLDPSLQAVVAAPPLPAEAPPPPPAWMAELMAELNEAARAPDPPPRRLRLVPPPEHGIVEARAHDYGMRVYGWLQAREAGAVTDPADPRAVVAWFHSLVPAKIHRALRGLAEDDPAERDWPPDYDGSAKVALLGIDRSHAAWLDLVDRGDASGAEAAGFIADLVALGDALERIFPNARAFVRPAFDEPDAVAALLANERAET